MAARRVFGAAETKSENRIHVHPTSCSRQSHRKTFLCSSLGPRILGARACFNLSLGCQTNLRIAESMTYGNYGLTFRKTGTRQTGGGCGHVTHTLKYRG